MTIANTIVMIFFMLDNLLKLLRHGIMPIVIIILPHYAGQCKPFLPLVICPLRQVNVGIFRSGFSAASAAR
jgi:hypothetical protein